MALPQTTSAWVINSQNGPSSLTFTPNHPIPELKPNEVLVKLYAASLNSRDLMIVNGAANLSPGKPNLIPASDGAGVILALGPSVSKDNFQVNDRVLTHLTHGLPFAAHPAFTDITDGLGHGVDGTLTQHGVFDESSLVKMPSNLSFTQAATLTCSGLTAWNALFGLESCKPGGGKTVLVQGSGGVSVAALQFALAAGASVIATTSSAAKAEKLRALGAKHVINYRETPDWGEAAKKLTPNARGVDIVVDVGGVSTLQQSLKAVRVDGLVVATGVLGKETPDGGQVPTLLDCLFASCIVRGIFLGSRRQFEEMNRFVEQHEIGPVLDEKVFDFASVREAYEYLAAGKHFSKVVIRLAEESA